MSAELPTTMKCPSCGDPGVARSPYECLWQVPVMGVRCRACGRYTVSRQWEVGIGPEDNTKACREDIALQLEGKMPRINYPIVVKAVVDAGGDACPTCRRPY